MKNNLENQDIKTDKPVPMSYEALKAERDAQQKRADALAVENAERGEIIERLIGIFTASGYHAIQNSYDPCMALLYDAFQAIKHPATSAALAAIEARGVDKLAAYLWKRGNDIVSEGGKKSEVIQVRVAAKMAEMFANELREAK